MKHTRPAAAAAPAGGLAPGDIVRGAEEMAGARASRKILWGFLPIGVLQAAFFFIPLAVMVLYSLWKAEGVRVVPDWTLRNYANLFTTRMYILTLLKTGGISLLVTLLLALSVALIARRFALRNICWT